MSASSTLVAPTIQAREWGWRHPGRQAWAVKDVSFDIAPGERVLLVGNSGSGKSTLLHGIAGVLEGEEGESKGSLTIAGLPASSPLVRGRVGMVQQDPESQRVMGRIGDEVAFGLENLGVPREEIWPRVEAALRTVGLSYPLARSTGYLSGGEKQRLALACALAMRPQVILLDEPTANLDPVGAEGVREATDNLINETGATAVIVDHNLGPWIPQVDRMIVLTEGGIVADGPAMKVIEGNRDLLMRAGVWIPGVDPADYLPRFSADDRTLAEEKGRGAGAKRSEMSTSLSSLPSAKQPAGQDARSDALSSPILRTSHLSVGYEDSAPVLTNLDLEFAKGRSTCIVGRNGAGKTTLALTLAGLLPPIAGKVEAGEELREGIPSPHPLEWGPLDLLGRLSMVFQEPQYQFLTSSVEEELALGLTLIGTPQKEITVRVEEYLERLHLVNLRKAHPLSLSGGERRRLGVGTALISSPKVVILDEPTFGQDFTTWVELVGLLQEARERAVTLIIVTHDLTLVRVLGQNVLTVGEEADEAGLLPGLPSSTRVSSPMDVSSSDLFSSDSPTHDPSAPTPPSGSFLSRVNPAVALLGLFLMTVPLMFSIDPVSAGVALLLEIVLLPFAGLRPRHLLIRLVPLLIAAPLAAMSMLLYAAPGGEIYAAWGPVVISENSLTLAVSIALRVFAVGMPAVVILPSLGSTEVADALTQIVRLPSRFVLSSLAAIRMVGLMVNDWNALRRARRSRGLKGSHFAKATFALITFALRRAESLSVSMEARGFGSDIPRSNARVSALSEADAIMLSVSVVIPAVALGIAAWTGAFTLFGIR